MSNLFSEFTETDHQEWLKIVEKELKTSLEPYEITAGLHANPFIGNIPNSSFSNIKKNIEGWTVFQCIQGNTSAEINSKILEALEGGVSGISLDMTSEDFDFEVVFKEVLLSYIQVRFYFSDDFFDSNIFFQGLKDYIADKDANLIFAGLTKDEAKLAAAFGKIEVVCKNEGSIIGDLSDVLREAENLVFSENVDVVVNLTVQENFYLNIAQHRALRIIWSKIAEVCNLPQKQIFVISNVYFTHSDPNTQVIAATQQTTSSVCGGTDAVLMQNIPFDADKYPESFASRITRNIQNVLWNESFLYRVNDPSMGSYFIDDLCQKMINEVWTLFIKDK